MTETLVQSVVTEEAVTGPWDGMARRCCGFSWASRAPVFSLRLLPLCTAFSSAPPTPLGGDKVLQQAPGKRSPWQRPHQPWARCFLTVDQLWLPGRGGPGGHWGHLPHSGAASVGRDRLVPTPEEEAGAQQTGQVSLVTNSVRREVLSVWGQEQARGAQG